MRPEFEIFKNNLAHTLVHKGDIPFIQEIIASNCIFDYWEKEQYEESLYLLAMIDYLSREHNMPLCGDYRELRKQKLATMLCPNGILMMDKMNPSYGWKEKAIKEAIPEFLRHNIVEGDIKNVV